MVVDSQRTSGFSFVKGEFVTHQIFCRGVPVAIACKKRKERMPAIGDAIADSSYDIVALQEVTLYSVSLCSAMSCDYTRQEKK